MPPPGHMPQPVHMAPGFGVPMGGQAHMEHQCLTRLSILIVQNATVQGGTAKKERLAENAYARSVEVADGK